MEKNTIGELLRNLRGERTQNEIAKDLGITSSSWAMYERDERVPRDEIKVRIAHYFGKSVQELFFDPIEHKECSFGQKSSFNLDAM